MFILCIITLTGNSGTKLAYLPMSYTNKIILYKHKKYLKTSNNKVNLAQLNETKIVP